MEMTKVELSLPSVSVIIAAYNEQAFIETTIASILGSGFPYEVIVVDDGSTDQTPKICEKFGEKIKVITHPTNRGKGAAMASGLKKATGEIVIFCDAHTVGLEATSFAIFGLAVDLWLSQSRAGRGHSRGNFPLIVKCWAIHDSDGSACLLQSRPVAIGKRDGRPWLWNRDIPELVPR
jgi:glycosyltransferase involved in cell wall biosynthesis